MAFFMALYTGFAFFLKDALDAILPRHPLHYITSVGERHTQCDPGSQENISITITILITTSILLSDVDFFSIPSFNGN